MGEWNTQEDPDCEDDVCADPIVKMRIRRTFHPSYYGRQKQHDILIILLQKSVNFNGKYI